MTSFGAFVELAEGIEGLIHVSEFDAESGEKVTLEVEQTYPMKVIKLSPSERKVGLSIRALKDDNYRADWGQYISEASSTGGATLGDHFKQKQ